ncbi:MAG: nuclear transport factor 2 family protein, partial [Chloroflexi bacterium]|nr:nuclear transport factor 2 family protein [Chloroflexota bacterium]
TEHWTNNHVIDGDGEQATHRCYLNLIRGESGESIVRAKYSDTLVKVDGQWKFSRRVVR